MERACRVSDAGLAACQATSAQTDECRAGCTAIADSCSRIPLGSPSCPDLVNQKCRLNGLEYCAADETVNGCNLVAAEDLRGQERASLDPMSAGCIMVSPGTVVTLESGFTLGSDPSGTCSKDGNGKWAWLGNVACAIGKIFRVVGGNAGDRDPDSPFNTVPENRSEARFDAPGTFGYWTLGGYWGAVIVDTDADK